MASHMISRVVSQDEDDHGNRSKASASAAVLDQAELILNSIVEGVHVIDAQGLITFVNTPAVEMLGWGEDDVIGRDQHGLIHHTHADGTPYRATVCPILTTLHDGRTRREDGDIFWRKDGTSLPVDYIIQQIHDFQAGVQELTLEELAGAQTCPEPELIFKYEILELCTALKPALLDHLFRVRGEEQLVYLDPDILVFRPLAELRPALRTSDIVVTPHFGNWDVAGAWCVQLGMPFTTVAERLEPKEQEGGKPPEPSTPGGGGPSSSPAQGS